MSRVRDARPHRERGTERDRQTERQRDRVCVCRGSEMQGPINCERLRDSGGERVCVSRVRDARPNRERERLRKTESVCVCVCVAGQRCKTSYRERDRERERESRGSEMQDLIEKERESEGDGERQREYVCRGSEMQGPILVPTHPHRVSRTHTHTRICLGLTLQRLSVGQRVSERVSE